MPLLRRQGAVSMADDRLQEIRERLAAATPGPWIAEYSGETGHCVIPHDARSTREFVARTQLYAAAADADLIAHAPSDMEYLLAEVARLQEFAASLFSSKYETVDSLLNRLAASKATIDEVRQIAVSGRHTTAYDLRSDILAAIGGDDD